MANPIPVPQPRPRDYKRFMDKVLVLPNGCWEWTGAKFQNGYSMFFLDAKQRRAHRVLYVWTYGELGAGEELDHLCRNRACVNPDHLQPASRRENTLRGDGPTAVNAKKTWPECGHSTEFTYTDPRGWRGCSICRKEAVKRYYNANRERINERKRAQRQRVAHDSRPCEGCGNLFTPIRSTKRYCSEKCQATANNRAQYKKRKGEL